MLKRLLKVGMLMCTMALACNSFAQNSEKPDFPRYGFWSNWSVGGELIYNYWQSGHAADQKGLGETSNLGLGLNLTKQLNWNWDFRFKNSYWGLVSNKNAANLEGYRGYDHYAATTIGFAYSLSNSCHWSAERKNNVYAFIDAGIDWNGYSDSHCQGEFEPSSLYCLSALYADLGLGISHKVGDKTSLYAEAGVANTADVPSPRIPFSQFKMHQVEPYVALGIMHHFGLTATDAEIANQKSQLTQDNFDKLNDEIDRLNAEVANAKNAEQKLQDKIDALNDEIKAAANRGNGAAADSLQNIINNIKADQLNFYAIPFSILYPNDVWRIPADQQNKVKAIARIMKDNENVSFKLIGFTDYKGTNEYNMKLSQRRAEEVKRVLVEEYGINGDRLSCDWKGEESPFGDATLPINRRTSVYRVIE